MGRWLRVQLVGLRRRGRGVHASADNEAANYFPEKLDDIVSLEGYRSSRETSAKLDFLFFDRNTFTSLHCRKKNIFPSYKAKNGL